ncbi:hypothetical protein MBLNU459_g6340t1 [Dothideomycetes sp. NU459]
MSLLPSAVAGAAGIATHLFYFKPNEPSLYPLRYVEAYLALFSTLLFAIAQIRSVSLNFALLPTLRLAAIYFTGLFLSLVTYRLFFNPLNAFPGPFLARLTRFDLVVRNRKIMSHKTLLALHQRYGKYVRIGPHELSITDPDATQPIHGAQSGCVKSVWYDHLHPSSALLFFRDRATHDRRRRIWSPGFSDKALRGYEPRIQRYNDLLMAQIESSGGEPMDISKWLGFYSFDVMGDLGFGRSFDMLAKGQMHWAIGVMLSKLSLLGLALPVWLIRVLLTGIPFANNDTHRFKKFTNQMLDDRLAMQGKMSSPDIADTLIVNFNKSDDATQKATLPLLQGDTELIVIAGSDTTRSTLTFLFKHLCSEAGLAQRLRQELVPLIKDSENITHKDVQDAPLLNACINEALRLYPAVPSGPTRETPKEGIHVGDIFIPGNVCVQMPGYAMARDETIYARATEFIPERFTTLPELIKHKDAHHPFLTGPYHCIGKGVAWTEMRTLVAQIIMEFDIAFAPGEDGSTLIEQSTDHFTMGTKPMYLVFTKAG